MGKIKPRPVKPRPLDMENLPDIGELTTMGAQVEAIDIEGQEKRQRTKEEAILTAAKSSIDAAISSILAMDILGPGRFLITNIHGSTLT